jgi:threonyl-tRNA synthetase
MPLWLAPEQVVVMTITDSQRDFAQDVVNRLQKVSLRAKADLRNEKIGFKIREHTLQKVPYLLVVGDKEVEADAVAVRTRTGEDLGSLKVDDLIAKLNDER